MIIIETMVHLPQT